VKEWLEILGPEFAYAVATAAAIIGLIKWITSRHDVKFTHRKTVLEHWEDPTTIDPLKAEVLCRQLVGVYLPYPLLLKICSSPQAAVVNTLLELAELWPLLRWDPLRSEIRWVSAADNGLKRFRKCAFLWISYFGAGIAGASILIFLHLRDVTVTSETYWAIICWCIVLLATSASSLWKLGAWGRANKLGDEFLKRINNLPGHVSVTKPRPTHPRITQVDKPDNSHRRANFEGIDAAGSASPVETVKHHCADQDEPLLPP
jgi:hypothetical protein